MIIELNEDFDLNSIKSDKIKAILICLFTDQSLDEGDSVDGQFGGWWGDAISSNYSGSKD